MSEFDVATARAQFPSLHVERDRQTVVYFDGPGGTQVPSRVIDATVEYYREYNANTEGAFETSQRSDAMLLDAHHVLADFVGAASGEEVKFGPNMTTLTFSVSRAIGKGLRPGDEVIITTLDHEANRSPWQLMAADAGVTVRQLDIDPVDCTLDLAALDAMLSDRTKVVAVGLASNAVGTINPVKSIIERAHSVGALAFIDAVHYGPHGPIDVQALGADILVCSVYKFFGPHLGVLWGRPEVLDSLHAYKVRPAHDRWETGTQDHEGIAGARAAVEYLADVGRSHAGDGSATRRSALVTAMTAISEYEQTLAARLLAGLAEIDGIRIWGITDPERLSQRTPTVALRLEGWTPNQVAAELGRHGIYVWDGDFYATALMERLDLADSGGVVRVGLAHYNTVAEVDRLLDELGRIARSSRP